MAIEPRSRCALCDKTASPEDFCQGCRKYICVACDERRIWAEEGELAPRHKVADHKAADPEDVEP
jgi:hypothetical protein